MLINQTQKGERKVTTSQTQVNLFIKLYHFTQTTKSNQKRGHAIKPYCTNTHTHNNYEGVLLSGWRRLMRNSCRGWRIQEKSKSVGLTSPLSVLLSLQGCEWVVSLVISSFRHLLLFSQQQGSESDDRERDYLWGKTPRWTALCQRPPFDKAPFWGVCHHTLFCLCLSLPPLSITKITQLVFEKSVSLLLEFMLSKEAGMKQPQHQSIWW